VFISRHSNYRMFVAGGRFPPGLDVSEDDGRR